jgi:hypothetical protein
VDARVREYATALQDQKLLAKLSEGDLVAIEAKYHPACLVLLYNRARATVAGHYAERHFAERHFAERHFAEQTFCRQMFCRTDVLPNGHFAERTV